MTLSRAFPGLSMTPAPTSARRVPIVSWAAAGTAKDYQDLASQIDELVETNSRDPWLATQAPSNSQLFQG